MRHALCSQNHEASSTASAGLDIVGVRSGLRDGQMDVEYGEKGPERAWSVFHPGDSGTSCTIYTLVHWSASGKGLVSI